MLQVQEAECGAVALWMVLAWHEAWVPLPEVRERCGVTRFGVNAAGLIRAASSFGLKARAVRLDPAQLAYLTSPTIVYWQQSHYLVLEGMDEDRAWINDPALGHRELTTEDFAAGYSGIAFPMTPGEEFQRQGAPARSAVGARGVALPARVTLAGLALLAIAESALLALGAYWLGERIDERPGGDASVVWLIAVVVVGLAVAATGQGLLSDRAIGSMAGAARNRYLDDLDVLPHEYVELRRAPELGGRLRLTETAGVLVTSFTVATCRLVAGTLAWTIVLAQVAWPVAVAFVLGVSGAVTLHSWVASGAAKDASRRHHLEGGRMADVAAMWQRRGTIRANGEEQYELQALAATPTAGADPAQAGVFALAALPVVIGLPLIAASLLAANGDLSVGGLAIAAFGSVVAIRLSRQPGSLLRDAAILPSILRQLDDSHDEAAWRLEREAA